MRRVRLVGLQMLLLGAAAVVFAGPVVFLVLASLKEPAELKAHPHLVWPAVPRWENYSETLAQLPWRGLLRNTLWYAAASAAGTVVSCSLAAYAFARLRWTGRDALFLVLIGTMLLPAHVTMIPRFWLARELGLYNSLWALILPCWLGDAFSIFLLRQFFVSIPEELSEAGRLDGLGEWGVFTRIVVPLSRPAIATAAMFQFLAAWNDFSGPLLFLRDPEKFTLSYGLERFTSAYSDQTHLLLAAAVLFSLPAAALFVLAQRAFTGGLTEGGVKQ